MIVDGSLRVKGRRVRGFELWIPTNILTLTDKKKKTYRASSLAARGLQKRPVLSILGREGEELLLSGLSRTGVSCGASAKVEVRREVRRENAAFWGRERWVGSEEGKEERWGMGILGLGAAEEEEGEGHTGSKTPSIATEDNCKYLTYS